MRLGGRRSRGDDDGSDVNEEDAGVKETKVALLMAEVWVDLETDG